MQPLEELKKRKSAIVQISLLFLIQWLSITVIILNALALNASKDSNQGLIMAFDTGLQDYISLILGAGSLFAVSLLLCLYLQIFFRLLGNHPISPSKKVLGTEIVFSIVITLLWTSATAINLNHFNESSACRKTNISTFNSKISFDDGHNNKLSSSACKLANAMIIIAFTTISLWFVTLLVSIYSLLQVCGGVGDVLFNRPPIIIHPYEHVSKLQVVSPRSSAYVPIMTKIQQHTHQQEATTVVAIDRQQQKQQEREEIIVISKPQMTSIDKEISPMIKSTTTTNQSAASSPHINNSAFSPLPLQQQQQQQQLIKEEELEARSQQQNYDDMQQLLQQQEKLRMSILLAEKLQQPEEARIHDTFDFDFSFAPIQVDLMLPSTSELIGSKKRRNHS